MHYMGTLRFAQDWKIDPYTPNGQIALPIDKVRHASETIERRYSVSYIGGQTTSKRYSFLYAFFYYYHSKITNKSI